MVGTVKSFPVRWCILEGVPHAEAARNGILANLTSQAADESIATEASRLLALQAELGRLLLGTDTLQEMLGRCTEVMVQLLDASFVRVWTLNERENVLELQASSGMYTHLDGRHSRMHVGQYKIGLIAQERLPHLTNKVVGDPRVSDQDWAIREGM